MFLNTPATPSTHSGRSWTSRWSGVWTLFCWAATSSTTTSHPGTQSDDASRYSGKRYWILIKTTIEMILSTGFHNTYIVLHWLLEFSLLQEASFCNLELRQSLYGYHLTYKNLGKCTNMVFILRLFAGPWWRAGVHRLRVGPQGELCTCGRRRGRRRRPRQEGGKSLFCLLWPKSTTKWQKWSQNVSVLPWHSLLV